MDANKTIGKVIPEGEFNCIWVEAGLISYKLCDRNLECDECPFDLVIRQKSAPAYDSSSSAEKKTGSGKSDAQAQPRQESLLDIIRNIFGAPLRDKPPADRSYSRGHVWVKPVTERTYRVGLDHYASSLLEGVGSVVFPQDGTASVRENPCAWIICDDATITVQSPINGKIVGSNRRLVDEAGLLRSDPYESGWLNEIASEEGIQKGFLDSSGAESVSREQFQQLKQGMLAELDNRPPALGVTLMDGGIRPSSLRDIIGPSEYVVFLQRLLSNRV